MIYKIRDFLHDVWADITDNIVNFIVITIQIIVVCFFSFFLISDIEEYYKVKIMMEKISEKGEMYVVSNNSAQEDDLYVFQYKRKEYGELYQYMKELDGLEFYVADSSKSSRFKGNRLIITKNFFEIFGIKCSFESETNEPTVVIGYNLGKQYKVGDYIEDYRTGKRYLVSDVMNKNTYYVAPRESAQTINLDDYMLFEYDDSGYESVNEENINDIITSFESMTFLAESRDVVNSIVKKAGELGLYKYEMQSFEFRKKVMLDNITEGIENDIFVISVLLFFMLINALSFIIQYIANKRRDFAIYMVCGCSRKNILMRIAFRQIISILIGIGLCINTMGISNYVAYLLIGFGIYLFIILLYPATILSKMTVGNLLRRNDE